MICNYFYFYCLDSFSLSRELWGKGLNGSQNPYSMRTRKDNGRTKP